ncbi:hypothetical protein BHM03_00032969 [Ensete ventricosum]|nr:hypothetical protein BHM03_00032969 [Ensete ventricosum]
MVPPVPGSTVDWGCFYPIATRNRLVTIDFDRRAVSTGYGKKEGEEARKKKAKKGEKEGESQTAPPSNGEAAARLLFHRVLRRRPETSVVKEPQDDSADEENLGGGDFFATAFSSFEVTRKRGGLCDVVKASPHPR